jgi:hypothetical protein
MITKREELRDLEIVREEELSYLLKLEGLLHRAVDYGEDKHLDNYYKVKKSIALIDKMMIELKAYLGLGD